MMALFCSSMKGKKLTRELVREGSLIRKKGVGVSEGGGKCSFGYKGRRMLRMFRPRCEKSFYVEDDWFRQ